VALTDIDVISALSDPVLQRMDFRVAGVHVRGGAYATISDLIDREQILVVSGNDPKFAHYNPQTDTITTQKADPPADLWNRSVLIHECTHAIADMEHVKVTYRTNEAAARMAHAVYLLVSMRNPPIPPGHARIMNAAIAIAKTFKLDTNPDAGAQLSYDDVIPLIRAIDDVGKDAKIGAYHQDRATMSISNGISPKASVKLPKSPVDPPQTDIKYHPMAAYRVPTDALFAFREHKVRPEAEPALEEAARYIKEFFGPSHRVYITGYTDSKGDKVFNKTLSERRAQAVARWLIEGKHVDASRVITIGEGESKPVAPNRRANGSDNPDGRAKNRRVEILIM